MSFPLFGMLSILYTPVFPGGTERLPLPVCIKEVPRYLNSKGKLYEFRIFKNAVLNSRFAGWGICIV